MPVRLTEAGPATPSGPTLASQATPLTCAPWRPARWTGNSAAGHLATQRSGNDEHRLSPMGAGGRGLGP
jgi:hypothetical protein